MDKKIIQLENMSSLEFKKELLDGVKLLLSKHENTSQVKETYLTRTNVAELLSISLVTLWKYTKEGIIPAFRIGTKVRYKESDVLAALKRMNKSSEKM